uniref:Secreted protein n=1 Tax=Anopheles melas TaxID=34690 RepID=A0A182UIQ0_9DIPT
MLIVCIGLLKLAVLEMAATCPGLPLSPISIALPSDSALDSSDAARIFRRSFFRLSMRVIWPGVPVHHLLLDDGERRDGLPLERGHRLVQLNVTLVNILMLMVIDPGQIADRNSGRYDRVRARVDRRHGGSGVGVSCVSCVSEPPVPGEAELGEIGTGTAVTCGRLGSGVTMAGSVKL